ncbi:SDR family oxidoreductase [Streptococcus iniae]|nr:SDR family oxidoreductase [Streptococcus iniae]
MLTKNIASEFGSANIQCNGIGPGYIATPQTAPLRQVQEDGSRHPFDQFIISKTPATRWGEAEDLVCSCSIFSQRCLKLYQRTYSLC